VSTTRSSFKLLPFQEEAAETLRDASLGWVAHAINTEVPKLGTSPIPFVGQLKAVTGAGKTPILAEVIGGLGDAVVLWTSKSSAVVEQTYNNLRDRYRGLLPELGVKVLLEIRNQLEWQDLIHSTNGLTIWVLTTASWNEAEAARSGGAADARLNLHREGQHDWAGQRSPWEQLRTDLRRPLWVVSDESHNQTDTQLDVLSALRPVGFFMASATPVHGELFDEWRRVLEREPDWRELATAGQVPVRTRDVVAAELLKTTIELVDYQSGTEENLDGALATLRRLEDAAAAEGASVTPRAIYVVEKSSPPKGSLEEARPVVIWRYLHEHGIPSDQIAVFTDTRDLPKEAEKVSSLSKLLPRHRHIIFNQSLQEGWDDPEAYVCYFDGVTRSFTRIKQIVGRVLRQPGAQRYVSEVLNTATLLLNTPTKDYDVVLQGLKAELRLYAPDDEPGASPIRVKTRRDPLPAESVKAGWADKLVLPLLSLDLPQSMREKERMLRTEGQRAWPQDALDAPGLGKRSVLNLASESVERTELIDVLRSARTKNGIYFRRRVAARNRNALNALDPDAYMKGAAFQQHSCQSSLAQERLTELADDVADYYEDRVGYDQNADPDLESWTVPEHRPRTSEMLPFDNAAHARYSRGNLNQDELPFAQALDAFGRGVWVRNPDSGSLGYHIPLPFKVGDSLRFFPDFLWWPDGPGGVTWAIDTTGPHLLQDKIRGKLVALGQPRMALVVRGHADLERERVTGSDGWSVVIARTSGKALVEHAEELQRLLELLDVQ
jgi:type III restriction enzyme